MKEIRDICLGGVSVEALEVSVLCLDCKENSSDPSLLDGWVQVYAFVKGKGLKEAEAARSDEVAWISIQLMNSVVHAIDVNVGVGVVEDCIAVFPNPMEEGPRAFDKGRLEQKAKTNTCTCK